jgi:hypothetical protein
MSAGWCVKCNFSTMILLLAPELHQAGQGPSRLPCEQYDSEKIAVDARSSQP